MVIRSNSAAQASKILLKIVLYSQIFQLFCVHKGIFLNHCQGGVVA